MKSPLFAAEKQHDWRLEINSSAQGGVVPAKSNNLVINLKLTNISNRSLNIWKDSNSWGYAMLSFVMTNKQGEIYTIRRKERAWRKNYPSVNSIKPGKSLIWSVSLGGSNWDGLQDIRRQGTYEIMAVISIPADEKTGEFHVWTGKLNSNSINIQYK